MATIETKHATEDTPSFAIWILLGSMLLGGIVIAVKIFMG